MLPVAAPVGVYGVLAYEAAGGGVGRGRDGWVGMASRFITRQAG